MGAILFSLASLICGSGISLLVFGLDSLLRNLPGLVLLARRVIGTINRATYQAYRFIFSTFPTNLPNLPAYRVVICGLLSTIVSTVLMRVFGGTPTMWVIGVGLAQGVYVGWVWDSLDFPEGLWMGEER